MPKEGDVLSWFLLWHCCLPDAQTPKDAGTKSLNLAIGAMYIMGYWVKKQTGICIAHHLLNFLQQYQKCAAWSMQAGRNRFPIKPKMHMVAHCVQRMLREASLPTGLQIQFLNRYKCRKTISVSLPD